MAIDITVIIPTYNRLAYLKQAIASCFAGNDGIAIEVVAVDDGSTDGTAMELAAQPDPKVRLFQQNRQGPQAARNRGLSEARGRYVKFLDDDDWLAAGSLSKQLALLSAENADICSGDIAVVDQNGGAIGLFTTSVGEDLFVELLLGRTATHNLRYLTRTELARQVKWQSNLKLRQDYDYFLRVARLAKKHVGSASPVGFFRQHPKPRVSTNVANNGPLCQLSILTRIAQDLSQERTDDRPGRIDAMRAALWQAAHHGAVFDWGAARTAWRLADALGPSAYLPERKSALLKCSDSLFGPTATEWLLLGPRRLRMGWR